MGYYYENNESRTSASVRVYYRHKGTEGGHYPLHWHKDIEIDLVLNGGIDAVVGGAHIYVGKGGFLFVNSGILHETAARDELLMESVTVMISNRLIKEYCPDFGNYSFEISKSDVKEKIAGLVYECGMAELEKAPFYKLKTDILAREILEILLTECLTENPENESVGNIASLRQAMAYIEENFRGNITLDDAAEQAGLTPTYFSRYFKKLTGQTFHSYLTRMRVYNAHRLLITGDDTVNYIASKSGFKNVKSFINAFRLEYGETPERYRRNLHAGH